MTDRELFQIALDALEHLQTDVEWQYKSPTRAMLRKIEKALRARLAQPEPYPENFIDALRFDAAQSELVIYARKEGDLIVADLPQVPTGGGGISKDEQPEPEPVAWGILNTRPTEKQPLMMVMLDEPEPSHLVVPLYTAQPQREWVGLTSDEISCIIEASEITLKNYCSEDKQTEYARAIEAKLKEKNGG
ncbi:hypothetical protein UFOVP137_48 [uncultured Caudovirales phage]|uniref:Uncharacterized protein n=1 Tax=uncultured Caudovirales phage TaxID=2100421 RepID=A0A6J5LG72_9CAUD|nr:hypothetical protein UFOVP137_48 [uncultured Caudovirales phage]